MRHESVVAAHVRYSFTIEGVSAHRGAASSATIGANIIAKFSPENVEFARGLLPTDVRFDGDVSLQP